MEMNKGGKNLKSLQQAMQEFEKFKKGKTLPAVATERAAPSRMPQYADKMLYCATHVGLAAQMILKLSPGHAEIVQVCKLAHKRIFGIHHAVPDVRDHVLRTHTLVIGNFEECPHCASTGMAYCNKCHTLSCLGPDTAKHCCPCCGYTAQVKFRDIHVDMAVPGERPRADVTHAKLLGNSAAQLLISAPRKK